MVIFSRAEHFTNIDWLNVGSDFDNVTSVSAVQDWKRKLPTEVTLSCITTFLIPSLFMNTPPPIVSTDSGNSNSSSELQAWNTYVPNVVTLLCIVTFLRLKQLANNPCGIVVRHSGITASSIPD